MLTNKLDSVDEQACKQKINNNNKMKQTNSIVEAVHEERLGMCSMHGVIPPMDFIFMQHIPTLATSHATREKKSIPPPPTCHCLLARKNIVSNSLEPNPFDYHNFLF